MSAVETNQIGRRPSPSGRRPSLPQTYTDNEMQSTKMGTSDQRNVDYSLEEVQKWSNLLQFEYPRLYQAAVLMNGSLASPIVQITLSFICLIGLPVWVYSQIPGETFSEFVVEMITGWDGLLRTSVIPITAFTLLISLYCGHVYDRAYDYEQKQSAEFTYLKCCLAIVWIFMFNTIINSQLQIVMPAWIWNPFLWAGFSIYDPSDAATALKNLCLDHNTGKEDIASGYDPLCLSEGDWKILSGGGLSSNNPDDVAAVLKGIDYVHHSGGIIVSVMCRDCVDSIQHLIENVENLRHFLPTMTVVVFENDSSDGSRDAFKQWADEAKGYDVDLIQCPEAEDCRFGESHRYDSFEANDYYASSAVGKMAIFRQRMVDYIVSNPHYADYTHMFSTDLDLGVSISPLGLLHSLGEIPNNPVASSARQTWPGSLGTLVPPYDFSAFRSYPTEENQRLRMLTEYFCGLSPAGDRWRNMCHAASSSHLLEILQADRGRDDIYRVQSAFNGAALYPLQLIRETKPKYDQGEDGQRCEHVGFNMSLKRPMYVNRKWTFNIKPSRPGGPTGVRALKNMARVIISPLLAAPLVMQTFICQAMFIFPVMRIGMHVFYPLVLKGFFVGNGRRRGLPYYGEKGVLKL